MRWLENCPLSPQWLEFQTLWYIDLMARLKFEIWRDDASGEQFLSQISEQNDRARLATMPNGRLVNTFSAVSDFDAFQQNYDWNGWGDWRPEPEWCEKFFTNDEAAAQALFIARRGGS
jgi:hypothetical protein